MPIVNLKHQYPYLHDEIFLEDPDPIFEVYDLYRRKEASSERQRRRYKAIFSLDAGDGIEKYAIHRAPSPEDIWLRNVELELLHEALAHIPPAQARRVYAHFILGMKNQAIAKREGVSSSRIHGSIHTGLRNLKAYFDHRLGEDG